MGKPSWAAEWRTLTAAEPVGKSRCREDLVAGTPLGTSATRVLSART